MDKTTIDTILINIWITENIDELKKICKSISRLEDIDDLFQICIEQILINKKFADIPDQQRLYFFSRLVRNQFHSKTSKYYYQYHRFKASEIYDYDFPDLQYEEPEVNLEWVNKHLDEMKKTSDWYYGRLFELYIELGCSITTLSQKTTIPINSVSRDINKVRKELNKKRHV